MKMKEKKIEEKIRLNKFIALCSDISRRKADDLIKENCIRVNGKVANIPGILIGKNDIVMLFDKVLKLHDYKYIKFYKPPGYIVTRSDESGRKTIYDLLPSEFKNLKPIGRLDKATSGLLILTNDGDLICELTHPKFHVEKLYELTCSGKLNVNEIETLAKGILLEGKKAQAFVQEVCFETAKKNSKTSLVQTRCTVVLYQGLNRQIRKMFESISHPVLSLKRLKHGTISIEGLKKGQFKYISNASVKELKNYIKKQKKIK